MAVQSGYGKQEPVDPNSDQMPVGFPYDARVFTIEPITSNTANYPDHSILLTLRLDGVSGEQVRVRHPEGDLGGRTRLVFRPEDARTLADLLRRHADALDREADNETPTRSPDLT